jgi:uncharacterized protein (UPF0332 family)
VTPEAARYLAKARLILEHARLMLTVNLTEDAGRSAYLAGYHATDALIFQRTGKVTKSHKGAHTEFARLTRNEPSFDAALRQFLPQKRSAITSSGQMPWCPIRRLPLRCKLPPVSSIVSLA